MATPPPSQPLLNRSIEGDDALCDPTGNALPHK